MAVTYFNAYHSYLKSIEPLNDSEVGRLFKALLEYSATGEVPELKGNERFIFPTMKEQIDRDTEKYSNKCKKNKENISIRWNTNEYERIPKDTNDTKEKEKEKEKEKKKEKNIYSSVPELNDRLLAFIEHRKKLKKPMTDESIKLIISKLNKLSPDPKEQIEILNQSIERGWLGVFELKQDKPADKVYEAYEMMDDWSKTTWN